MGFRIKSTSLLFSQKYFSRELMTFWFLIWFHSAETTAGNAWCTHLRYLFIALFDSSYASFMAGLYGNLCSFISWWIFLFVSDYWCLYYMDLLCFAFRGDLLRNSEDISKLRNLSEFKAIIMTQKVLQQSNL